MHHIKFVLLILLVPALAYAIDPALHIEGLNEEQSRNVQGFLSLAQEPCHTPKWRIQKLFEHSDQEINKALRALGYYAPTIEKKLIFANDCWQADFSIDPGQPVRVESIRVRIDGEAGKMPVFQKLMAHLPIKKGDILNHGKYEKIKSDLNSLALEYGYLNHKLTTKILRVDPKRHRAEIELVMNSGRRHYFGTITIKQDVLDPEFVNRFIAIKAGQPYSSKKLAQTYNLLAESIYFTHVDVQPEMDEIEDLRVPVAITLEPSKRHDYTVGIGYETDIGPIASANYQNRRLNRKGHHLNVTLDISPILSSAEARYVIPFVRPRTDSVTFGAGYKYEKPSTFKAESAKLSLQYLHVYKSRWQQTLFLDFNREKFTVSDVTQTTTLLVPGARWLRTHKNQLVRPTSGYRLDLTLSTAAKPLLSDVSFIQTSLTSLVITPLPWPARVIGRVNLGATLTTDLNRLPASYRFYAGGTNSIRGYGYKKLGPTDDNGDIVGGKYISVASLEYEQLINDRWGVAVFMDGGNAFNANSITIKYSAGLGARWISPIGPIRLDFAMPLNDSGDSFRIHFAAGNRL